MESSIIEQDFEMVNRMDTLEVDKEVVESVNEVDDGADEATTSVTDSAENQISSRRKSTTSIDDKGEEQHPSSMIPETILDAIPQPILELAMHTYPVRSGVVVVGALITFILATFDFGFTVPCLISRILEFLLVMALGFSVGINIDQKYINCSEHPRSTVRRWLKPKIDAFIVQFDELWQILKIASGLSLIFDGIQKFSSKYLDCLYCSHPIKTIKAIVILHAASKLLQFFSFAGLFLLATTAFFSIPLAYSKNKEKVDHLFGCINKYCNWNLKNLAKFEPKAKSM